MIIDGQAVATKHNADGQELQVFSYEKGQYFGERALLTNEARAASILVTVIYFFKYIYSLTSWMLYLWTEIHSVDFWDLQKKFLEETWTSTMNLDQKSSNFKMRLNETFQLK